MLSYSFHSKQNKKEKINMKPFDKVIGYQKVKDELNQILDMIQNPAIYE